MFLQEVRFCIFINQIICISRNMICSCYSVLVLSLFLSLLPFVCVTQCYHVSCFLVDAAVAGAAGWTAQWPKDPGERRAAVEEAEGGGTGWKRGERGPAATQLQWWDSLCPGVLSGTGWTTSFPCLEFTVESLWIKYSFTDNGSSLLVTSNYASNVCLNCACLPCRILQNESS